MMGTRGLRGPGWEVEEGGGYSDRIHGPTDGHNDRAQYVIDYAIMYSYVCTSYIQQWTYVILHPM